MSEPPSGRSVGEAIAELFGQALKFGADEQRAFVEGADAPEHIRREVLELLSAHRASIADPEELDADLAVALIEDGTSYDDAHSEAGRLVGTYRIIEPLGRGGMGVVYLAERADGAYDQRVALKLLPPSVRSESHTRRFTLERQILARLEHPGIARLLDGGASEHGEPYLVMEYVDGDPLTEWCDRERLGIRRRLELFLDVCDVVGYAHGRLTVHRDLKPSNILVSTEEQTGKPQVKLLDFGIAKLLVEDGGVEATALTQLGLRPYTPGYAAPEQRRGQPVTVATDVYGLGVLLYELLSGHRPDTGRGEHWTTPGRPSTVVSRTTDSETDSSSPDAIGSHRTSRPERLRRRLAGDLDTIALKALREEPSERYGSVQALAEDVRRHLQGLPITARPASPPYRVRKFIGRHRFGVAGSALLSLAVIGGLVGTTWQARQAARERDAARLEADKLAAAQDYLVSLFEAADPAEALGEEITARQLLERGIERIDGLDEQPAVQIDMHKVLARVAIELADYDQADELLQQALPRAREFYGEEHLTTADVVALNGRLHYHRGEWAEAETSLEAALATYERLGAEERWQMLDALEFLGVAIKNQDRPEEVVEIQRRAVELSRRVFGERSQETATSLNQLGLLLDAVHDYEAAEIALRESLAIAREVHGGEHPEVATTLVNLANTLVGRGNLAAAEPYYRDGIAMDIRLRGRDHPRYAVKLHNLATFLNAAGRYQEAADLHQEVVEVLEQQFGEQHPYTGAGLDSLASDLAAAGHFEQALPVYERAGRVLLATAGRESSPYAIHRRRLAHALCDVGRCAEASLPVGEAVSILESLGPAGEAQLTFALGTRAIIQRQLGALAEAETDLRRSLEKQEQLFPPGHFVLGRTLSVLADVLVESNRLTEAASIARESFEILDACLAEDHPWRADAHATLTAIRRQTSAAGQ